MFSKLVFTCALAGSLAAAFASASCGPTCHGSENCGNSSDADAVGEAGTTGTSDASKTCPQFKALESCLSSYCRSASNPFCTCFTRGYDLGADCRCAAIDGSAYCAQAEATGAEASDIDCQSLTSGISSSCVPVQ